MSQLNCQAVITTPQGTLTYLFPDQATAQAWIDLKAPTGMLGNMAVPAVAAVAAVAEVPAVLDTNGNVITPEVPAVLAVAAQDAIPAQYTVAFTDLTAQATQAAAVANGLANQDVGATIIANIFAMNEAKLTAGTLTITQLQAMMQDATVSLIRELLWAGSLATAKALITAYSGAYFTDADKTAILSLMTAY